MLVEVTGGGVQVLKKPRDNEEADTTSGLLLQAPNTGVSRGRFLLHGNLKGEGAP